MTCGCTKKRRKKQKGCRESGNQERMRKWPGPDWEEARNIGNKASGGWSQKGKRKCQKSLSWRMRWKAFPCTWNAPQAGRSKAFEKEKRDAQQGRGDWESKKQSNLGGIRRNTGLCERRKEYGAGRGGRERTFVPSAVSVPLKPLFRCDRQCSEKTLSCWQPASVVVNEGDEAYTTNLCQKCFNKHLQAKGEEPLTNVKWRHVVEKKAYR